MSDTPKFEVIDRRKFKAEEEQDSNRLQTESPADTKAAAESAAPSAGPRLVVNEARETDDIRLHETLETAMEEEEAREIMPPSAEESRELKAAYDAASERLEELVRAQNPGMGAQPPITFQHLVQQFYMSAMIQMGAGSPEGQHARVDIVGARGTIDLLGVIAEKTRGNLTPTEDRALQAVLFEVRMAFNELTTMINLHAMQPPPPPPGKR